MQDMTLRSMPTRMPLSRGWLLGLQQGDVVVILSNGGFDGIYEKLPRKLELRK